MEKIKLRCNKCGLVLKVSSKSAGKVGKCPRCGVKFRIPGPENFAQRKDIRAVISECEDAVKLSTSLTVSAEPPVCLVQYTEVSPMDFALNRRGIAPLLDLSEGGLSFYLTKDIADVHFKSGEISQIAIDSPIFIMPISCAAQTRWVKETDTDGVVQVGISFDNPDDDFKKVIDFFVTYILSRAELWEAE